VDVVVALLLRTLDQILPWTNIEKVGTCTKMKMF